MPIPTPRPIAEVLDFLQIPASPFRGWALGLYELSQRHFPDNIFAHYDLLVAQFWREGASNEGLLMTYCQKVNQLYASLGVHSCVRFRYEHDFLYGFDWAKWIAADLDCRKWFAPFSFAFIDYLEHRVTELHELIALDDEKYHRDLGPGTHRNPFSFGREPSEERLLMEALYEQQLLPVKAWEVEFLPDLSKDYILERKKIAILLQAAP